MIKILLIGLAVAALVVIAIVVFVVYLAFRPSARTPGKVDTGNVVSVLDREEKEILDIADKNIRVLRQTIHRIENRNVLSASTEVCEQMTMLVKTLREKPETILKARKFLNYYLPTSEKILTKYEEMEQKRMADSEMTEKIILCLGDIRSATEKQHKNLYTVELLDLTAEMDVMTMVCKRDGLIKDEQMIQH